MPKLTKQTKGELFTAAIEKLFGDKIRSYFSDLQALTETILENDRVYTTLMAEKARVSQKFKETFIEQPHRVRNIAVDGKDLEVLMSHAYNIGPTENEKGYSWTDRWGSQLKKPLFGRKAYAVFLGPGLKAESAWLKIDTKELPQFKGALDGLRKRRDELCNHLEMLETLIMGFNTHKQLQELAPDLFQLLPSQQTKHALPVPVEALTTINELFKQVA